MAGAHELTGSGGGDSEWWMWRRGYVDLWQLSCCIILSEDLLQGRSMSSFSFSRKALARSGENDNRLVGPCREFRVSDRLERRG